MEKQKSQVNVLELKAAKLAIMTFAIKDKEVILGHICTDNMTVLSYVMKMCGTKNQELLQSAKIFGNTF